ncbi:MAG TPA: helix-turn-helix transcriptional regulator [Pseudonocardiaceae bacterium]|nr:helix-turn-helix transcriptional regulator [Pseudonocardiaceae bacterium]
MDEHSVSARLRRLRKLRGLTQHQLAAGSHFSVSLIQKVEQGTQPPSAAFVARVAHTLAVTPQHLYGTEEQSIFEQPQAEAVGIGSLRTALDAYDDPTPEGDPLDLATVVRRLDQVGRQIAGLRYAEATSHLPDLLHHLYVLAEQPGHAGERSRAALHDAYRMAATLAGRFRQADLAAVASERHVRLAPLTGDPLRIAISAYHRSSRHLQHGEYRTGLRILERARVEVTDTAVGRAVTIQLDLRSAVLVARTGDTQAADGYLDRARAIIKQFGPPASPYYNIDASALNVAVHWCAAPVENYDATEAIRRAQQVTVVDPNRPERVAHHHIDMGRAWMLHGDREQAMANLNAARHVAPFNTRNHPSVRETILALAEADRRRTESLANFARWAGIAI